MGIDKVNQCVTYFLGKDFGQVLGKVNQYVTYFFGKDFGQGFGQGESM